MDKNLHLDSVLKTHSMNLDEGAILENYKKKRKAVKEALEKKFAGNIDKIIDSGSYAKSTAINTKFDMDLCIHFKKGSYKTLKEMYADVYDYLKKEYKKEDSELITVREQKVSVGLIFNVEGEDLLFDITPGRKTSEESSDNDVYLHVNNEEDESKWTKTNIGNQIEHIKGRGNERESIRLLKVWKFWRGYEIKSIVVELLTIKAFDTENINDEKGLWNRLKKVIEYMRDNIETVSLTDPGNSANNVAGTLSDKEKTALKDYLKEMLEKIEKDDTILKYYFPENPKYASKNEGYDHSAKKSASILTPTTFG